MTQEREAEPAMTPEEWASVREDHVRDNALEKIASGYYFYTRRTNEKGVHVPRPDEDHYVALIAFANSLLPDGHPLKITRERVETAARMMVCATDGGEWHTMRDQEDVVSEFAALIAALRAFLPPIPRTD